MIDTRNQVLALFSTLWLGMGCGNAVGRAASPSPVTSLQSTPVTEATRTPLSPSAAVEPSPVADAPQPASEFFVVANGVSLFPTEGGLLLYNGSDMLAEVSGDAIVAHPEYLGTYVPEMMTNLEVVGGKWPERGLISVARPEARSSYSTVYEKSGKGWRKVTRLATGDWMTQTQLWHGGRTIALVRSMYAPDYRLAIIHGPGERLPTPAMYTAKGDGYSSRLPRVAPVAFTALTSGELFVLGVSTEDNQGWAVERWAPGSVKSVVQALPGTVRTSNYTEPFGIVALAGNDAYAYGKVSNCSDKDCRSTTAYLAHFDGNVWSEHVPPTVSEVTSFARVDKTLWLVGEGRLFKQSVGSSDWQNVPLPSVESIRKYLVQSNPYVKPLVTELSADRVHADKDKLVWVDASIPKTEIKLVLRDRPAAAVWQAPNDTTWAHSVQQFQPYRTADDSCQYRSQQIYVMLYATTKFTPKDYDYPLTRAALKGHAEFKDLVFAETEELGRHYFGAFVPEFNLELARSLVKVVQTGVKGSKPVALCRNPKQLRILGIDLATGAVTSNTPVAPE